MPKNRYDNLLRDGNQSIIDLTPGNYVLRIELSLELKNIIQNKNNVKMLEIGVGEGDLTKYILKNNKSIHIDCLDISKEMLGLAKHSLSEYVNNLNFICADALDFLNTAESKYDIIISGWTIHNFI
jgi:ubiquinone/menaquinone biosynthesis C-methylase UbiE